MEPSSVGHIDIPKSWALSWLVVVLSLQAAPAAASSSESAIASVKEASQTKPGRLLDAMSQPENAASHRPSTSLGELQERDDTLTIPDEFALSRQRQTSVDLGNTSDRSVPNDSSSPRFDDSERPLSTAVARPVSLATEFDLELDHVSTTPTESLKPDVSKKEPKSAAPLLQTFIDEPWPVTAQSTVASPPAQQRPAPAKKPLPTEQSGLELPSDPELGVIQVAEVQRDDELGVIQLRSPLQDPELGIIELRQISPPQRRSPFLYLSSFVTASSSDNVFLVEDPLLGRFDDNYIRPGISFTAFPALGPDTNLLLATRATLLRYEEQSSSNYDELRFQAGIRHQFAERVYGQFSLSYQLLYDEGYTEQFFTNTGIEVTVGRRDRLTPQLTLDSYYQGQLFFSDPERFSNVLNSIGAYLGYRITPQWDTGVGYRLTISDFTQQSRHETYQRITGQLRYSLTPAVRLSLFGGVSYGRSSESQITFDDTFFGISLDATVSIF